MALESFPPLLLVASRFILSGAILLCALRLRGMLMPRGRELWMTALYGVLILGVGNGGLTFAELLIPSSLAALFITVGPFWMVGIEAAFPNGERLHWPTVWAMLVGLGGVALLIGPSLFTQGLSGGVLRGFFLLQLSCASWSFGALSQRRQPTKTHPIVQGAIQQLAAGLVFLIPAIIDGRGPAAWTGRSTLALLYLVTFGSIVGYSSYIYALAHLPVAVVSLYNYINPIVAAVLGWLIYREPFGMREALAMTIIFAGVALVKRSTRPS
jgi:drug/metabolite transporter (DMT)-like permease